MFKNIKLSTSITLAITIIVIACTGVLFLTANDNMTSAMRDTAVDHMVTSLEAKTQIIESYVDSSESTLMALSRGGELKKFLKDPTNTDLQAEAQAYTEKYFADLKNWEGIYLSDWNTHVITHSNKKVVGMTMRTGEALTALQNGISSANGKVFSTGIIVSPASGRLVLSMYCPIYDDDGTTILGFVGGATLASNLNTVLDKLKINGLKNVNYTLINANTGTYIFNENKKLMAKEIKDPLLLSIMKDIKKKSTNGNEPIEYTGKDGKEHIAVYNYIPERGWALILSDSASEIYAQANANRTVLGLICLISVLLISFISWIIIKINTKPLGIVENEIIKLKNLNLKQDTRIKKYINHRNEIGQIANAIDTLEETFRGVVDTLNTCSASLNDSSNTMSNTSEILIECVENNAATTEELSASIISTNSSIDTVTREVVNISDMVLTIEEKVKDGRGKSKELLKTSTDMREMAEQTLNTSVNKIGKTKKEIEEAIQNLHSLMKINEMANQILQITSQTNLLSLNASIEAARAGDAGKGFAVVAGEIGNLANSSSRTASEIQHLCEDANRSIEMVRECFNDIIKFMEEDVAGKFEDFVEMAKGYGSSVASIQSAIGEIDEKSSVFIKSVTTIKEQIEHVSMASSDNAAGVEEIINKNEKTTMTADDISRIALENKTNAVSIKEIVEKFSSNDETILD